MTTTALPTPLTDAQKSEINDISREKLEIKAYIKKAKLAESKLDDRLAELIGKKESGTTTQRTNGYKASTVAKVNFSVDQNLAANLREKFGSDVYHILPVKYSVNATEYKSLMKSVSLGARVSFSSELTAAITSKPAKLVVKVEEIKGDE